MPRPAVYVATFARTYKHWFRVHAALQVLTAALVTAGFAIVVSGKTKMGSPHFAGIHEVRQVDKDNAGMRS